MAHKYAGTGDLYSADIRICGAEYSMYVWSVPHVRKTDLLSYVRLMVHRLPASRFFLEPSNCSSLMLPVEISSFSGVRDVAGQPEAWCLLEPRLAMLC